jgi:hypothetical protein
VHRSCSESCDPVTHSTSSSDIRRRAASSYPSCAKALASACLPRSAGTLASRTGGWPYWRRRRLNRDLAGSRSTRGAIRKPRPPTKHGRSFDSRVKIVLTDVASRDSGSRISEDRPARRPRRAKKGRPARSAGSAPVTEIPLNPLPDPAHARGTARCRPSVPAGLACIDSEAANPQGSAQDTADDPRPSPAGVPPGRHHTSEISFNGGGIFTIAWGRCAGGS